MSIEPSLYHFEVPPHRIARAPARPRDAARLAWSPAEGRISDHRVRDLPGLLRSGDLLVFNDTRVFPARLRGVRFRKKPPAACRIEILLTSLPDHLGRARVLVRPAKRVAPGDLLFFFRAGVEAGLKARVLAKENNQLHLAFSVSSWSSWPPGGLGSVGDFAAGDFDAGDFDASVLAECPEPACFSGEPLADAAPDVTAMGPVSLSSLVSQIGETPLPPYLRRLPEPSDASDYQTVFARHSGSVAAPTAGLHFTRELLASLYRRGIRWCRVRLHVGQGTFAPLTEAHFQTDRLHPEWGELPAQASLAMRRCRARAGRIIIVGTTTMRLLETACRHHGGHPEPYRGMTDLFLYPGKPCYGGGGDMLMTNFHLPDSSLLMLVGWFAGVARMQRLYAHALAGDYRFYSYGDAALLERQSSRI